MATKSFPQAGAQRRGDGNQGRSKAPGENPQAQNDGPMPPIWGASTRVLDVLLQDRLWLRLVVYLGAET
jgi:hypothetical protein